MVVFAPAGTAFDMTFCNGVSETKTLTGTPYVVGVDQDEYFTTFRAWPGKNKLITSALKRVDVGVSTAISNYLGGSARGRNLMLNATNGGVGFAQAHDTSSNAPFFGPITPTIVALASSVQTMMALGTFSTETTVPTVDVPWAPIIGVIAVAALLIITCCCLFMVLCREKAGKPVFKAVDGPKSKETELPKA